MAIRLLFALAMLAAPMAFAQAGLTIETGPTGKAYLAHDGAPLFAFGPGDEARTLSGGNDVARWTEWQRAHGMNLVRAYPASVPIDAFSPTAVHPFQQEDGKWNVDAWNDAYFEQLGEVAEYLEDNGIILHLQLWQIVWFKGGSHRWEANYINRQNNVNEWTADFRRGRDYIDAPADSLARAHQKEWVRRVVGAVKDRRNVIIDVINELGNEMGTLEWAVEVTRWIREFEEEHGATFIIGVDSEHHYRDDIFRPVQHHFDLIILNELRSVDFARNVIAAYDLPAVTVRPSDGRNRWEDYMFARADQTGPEHQTRYRTLCYRSLFAGVQSIGAYWKMNIDESDYRDMEHWPQYAEALRAFWETIAPEWPELSPAEDFITGDTVTPHAHGLRSPNLLAIYLECGSHTWNNDYEASELTIHEEAEPARIQLLNPRTGEFSDATFEQDGGTLRIPLPAFTDDLAVLVWRE